MQSRLIPLMALALSLAPALVHAEDAKDPDVKARIALMQSFKAQTKVLGLAATGKAAFDPAQIEATIAALRDGAAKVGPAFKTPADDPESTAQPAIWTARSEFRQKTNRLIKAVEELDGSDAGALARTLEPVTAACKDCHGRFKM
ncbi:c-type cytochrome [Rhodobacter sp. TJ_12]|uniref:c-type cytochrome n=1 Tax=Rhodobacter sp. TJ_12 TaxID=2029399 RepID=UPI001CBE067D|nr:cytochrome c [Rhodobacter sp. TJ_12]